MNNRFIKTLSGLCLLLLAGCYPEGPEYVDELDIVYTNYYSDYDFASKSTFSLPDQVVRISGSSSTEDEPEFVDEEYASVILNKITENMESMGYMLVAEDANPDLILLPTVSTTTNLYYYYDWGYWDWYYPGYYPGWGWYYPGWYYPPYVSGYRSGSLFIQMTDPELLVDDKIQVVWNAVVNGLLEGSTQSITTRLETTIDQAFEQSSYLAN